MVFMPTYHDHMILYANYSVSKFGIIMIAHFFLTGFLHSTLTCVMVVFITLICFYNPDLSTMMQESSSSALAGEEWIKCNLP